MAAPAFLQWKTIWPMLVMVAAGSLLGLAANFFAARPLPLLQPLAPVAPTALPIGEVDAAFVLQAGNAPGTLLLDARAATAFGTGRIPGALSLPLGEFDRLFPGLEPQLRAAALLVVYCSDPNCSDSPELARRLWAKGLKSLLLYRGGMEDWSGRGHAVEK